MIRRSGKMIMELVILCELKTVEVFQLFIIYKIEV